MAKQLHNDGFTLIEMILVLALLSIIVMIFPLVQMKSSTLSYVRMEYLKSQLLQAQFDAIQQKQTKEIHFSGQHVIIDDREIAISLTCDRSFHFNESGNVSQAMTLTCSSDGVERALVIQLGSGRMYVK